MLAALLLVAKPGVIAGTDKSQESASDRPSTDLYVSDGDQWQRYVPLDPLTLADTNAPPVDFGEEFPTWDLSADGSTLVRVSSGGSTVVVYDTRTGEERLRFDPQVSVIAPYLSADGSRLIMHPTLMCGPGGCAPATWYVFDTSDGRLLTQVEVEGGHGMGPVLIAPSARRMYDLYPNQTSGGTGPWPVELIAYDLVNGKVAGRLALPGVLGGTRWGREVDGAPVADAVTPGIALSPDGKRIAIAHADPDQLTLIDADNLAVLDTLALTRPTSLLDRLIGFVSPQSAEAKYFSGTDIWAVFAPDGRRLYVFGREGIVGDAPEEVKEHGRGIKVVDVETGEIVAEALGGVLVDEILPAPDGQSIYVLGPREPWSTHEGAPPYHLFRLDAHTLDVLAKREFPEPRRVFLWPVDAVPPAMATRRGNIAG